ncbi:MAG: hypothetical protein GX303_06130 [Clostridiales bacterium]|nr:hypothetical protein [Clostridiales bacterium]
MKMYEITKKMIVAIGVLSLLIIGGGVIYYRSVDCLPFIVGTLLGSGVSVLKVKLLADGVDKSLKMEAKAAANYIRLQHFLRLLLVGVVLLLAALVPWISLWGAAAGVFTFQISLYFLKFSMKK